MKKYFKKKFKNNISRIIEFLTDERSRKSLISILSKNTEGFYFDETVIEGLDLNSEYKKIYMESLKKAGDLKTNNIYKILRHLSLYSYIEDVIRRDIEGDFAECGCWKGNSLLATKFLIDKYNLEKSFHIFDSFEGGLSDFKEKDIRNSSIRTDFEAETVKKQFRSSYEDLLKKTEHLKNLKINKGWIPDILRSQKDRNYCFVHIDVDLYEPTLESHKYFFKRWSKGGVIICDDYGYRQFPGAKIAVDEFIKTLPKNSFTNFFKPSIGTSIIIK